MNFHLCLLQVFSFFLQARKPCVAIQLPLLPLGMCQVLLLLQLQTCLHVYMIGHSCVTPPFCINKLHDHALHALNSDLLTYIVSSWYHKAQKHIPMQELCTYTCNAHIPVSLEAPQNCKNPFTLVGHPFSSATCICEAQNALPDVTGSQGHTSGSLTPRPSIVHSTGNIQCGKTSFQLPSNDQQWPHPEWKKF